MTDEPQRRRRKPRNKDGAKKFKVSDDLTFDSKMEYKYYYHLLSLQQKGEIAEIELQPKYLLQEKFVVRGEKIQAIYYKADFLITYPDGTQEVIDVKGAETKDFKLKRKMFLYRYPDLPLRLVAYDKWGKLYEK